MAFPLAILDSLSGVAPASGNKVFVVEKTFDLSTLSSTKLINADIVNLFSLPANTLILGAGVKVTSACVGAGGTSTVMLRFGTTNITAAADMLTANTVAIGGATTTALPKSVGSTAADLIVNLVVAVGSGTVTTNPTVRVTIACLALG